MLQRSAARLRPVIRSWGIDRAVLYTVIGRGWSILAGPLTLVLIGRSLRADEQGFYYTFGSVIALNIFFELGLTYVLVQFASHEKANLGWTSQGVLSGSEIPLVRLAALLKMALKWYAVAAGLVLLVVMPAGLLFFARNAGPNAVAWRSPWICLTAASALNLYVSPLFAILEGCGRISAIASMRIGQGVFANSGMWLTLLVGGALFAAPVFQALTFGIGAAWLFLRYRNFFKNLLGTDTKGASLHWGKEVWPFQWRIAVSWLSGFVIFQLLNPILFASHGPAVAGRMGMSLSLCNALLNVSLAWMNTKASPFGALVATERWAALDTLFFTTLRQSLLILVAGSTAAFLGVLYLGRNGYALSARLIPPLPFALILISTIMNHVLFCESMYLRAHKSEPYLTQSIVMGLATCVAIFLVAAPFSVTGVSLAFFLSSAFGLGWGTKTFVTKRAEWHT